MALGVIIRARGNRGEVALESWCAGAERFLEAGTIELVGRTGGEIGKYRVEDAWEHRGRVILKFEGVDGISEAERLSGAVARIPVSQRRALPDGEYFHSDLVGCVVYDRQSGKPLGKVLRFEESGGAGLLEVEGGLLVPFVRKICVEIDIAGKAIHVDLPDGLKELNRP